MLATSCDRTTKDPEQPRATALPTQLSSWDAAAGEARVRTLLVKNDGTQALRLESVEAQAPFRAEFEPVSVAVGASVPIDVVLESSEPGEFESALRIATNDPQSPVLEVPLYGEVGPAAEHEPLEQWLLGAELQNARCGEGSIALDYLVQIPPAPPGVEGAAVSLAVNGELPPESQTTLAADQYPVGPWGLSHLVVEVPLGEHSGEYGFRVTGSVVDPGTMSVALASPFIQIPNELFAMCPPPKDCDCPENVPKPTSTVIADKVQEIPNHDPPKGKKPSQEMIATVTGILRGPKKGECCKGGKFHFTLKVAAEAKNADGIPEVNPMTNEWMFQAMEGENDISFSGKTNGKKTKVEQGDGHLSKFDGRMGRAEVDLKHEVLIKCEGPECKCSLETTKFITTLELSAPGKEPSSSSVEAHWSIGVDGKDCTLSTVKASVDRIVYIWQGLVYDPKNDKFLDKDKDPDKDKKTTYDEVVAGTDPLKK